MFRVQGEDRKNLTFSATNWSYRENSSDVQADDPSHTSILVENINGAYYLHRIVLGGQDRGFEFPLPDEIQSQVSNSTHVVIPASGDNAQ